RDRARTREHRDRERRDRGVALLDALRHLLARLAALALGPDHLERRKAEDHAARDAERGQRHAEDLEDQVARGGEQDQHQRARDRRLEGRVTPALRRVALRHRQERRDHREGVDHEEDRDERDDPGLAPRLLHARRQVRDASWSTRRDTSTGWGLQAARRRTPAASAFSLSESRRWLEPDMRILLWIAQA